jgi:predicted PhzF superfamily epimerase YddE/YHI9
MFLAVRPLIFHVNAFCGPGSLGNPGAVCLLQSDRSSEWMQLIAEEMNLSETGFVRCEADGRFSLRWFTPTKEIPICGHVTLGAAHVLWNEVRWVDFPSITFQTASGPLSAHWDDRGIELRLPANVCRPIRPPDWLSDALEIAWVRVLGGDRKYLIELQSEADVLRVRPDFGTIRRLADRGVIITSGSSGSEYDFVSRYFAGYVGIDEDPVTGSAHCCLIPFWSARLGKQVLRARQLSKRGGELTGELVGTYVRLTGHARTALEGELCV